MYKIAVLGDRDSIYGFATLGLDIFFVSNQETAVKEFHHLAAQNYAVIYITEKLYTELSTELLEYRTALVPAIIPIPGVLGNTGIGMENVRCCCERAVGSDFIFNEMR